MARLSKEQRGIAVRLFNAGIRKAALIVKTGKLFA